MDFHDFDWQATLQAVAPGLAAAFGGPAAGVAVKILADKLLGRSDASEDEVKAALGQGLSGEQIVAVKKAEQDFQVELARIQSEGEKAALEDVQSARQQTVELAQADSRIAWAPVVISSIITAGFFVCVVLLFVIDKIWDERQANLLNVLFGALVLGFGQVCNYWLGSSAGSKRAGDAVRRIAEQKTEQAGR